MITQDYLFASSSLQTIINLCIVSLGSCLTRSLIDFSSQSPTILLANGSLLRLTYGTPTVFFKKLDKIDDALNIIFPFGIIIYCEIYLL